MPDPAQEAYDRGDYQAAARLADQTVLKGLALIMIGNPLDGLPLLSNFDPTDPAIPSETVATLAFGHWLHGDADEARAILGTRRDAALTGAFLEMLADGPISCLFQTARAPLLTSCKSVGGFAVTTVGSGGQDCDIALDDCDGDALAAVQADAAFLFGFDFAGPPPDRPFGSDTPYLIHLTDPDVHVLTGLHPLRRYDRAITGTSGQASMITAIAGIDSVSAPFFGGLSAFHPSLSGCDTGPEPARRTDLFFSGSYGTPIYHEKPARFFDICQIPEPYRIELFDKTRPLPDYAQGLRRAKFALVSVRAPGSFSTRAMQALECGAFVLCEADSGILDYFPGPDWGVFTYRPECIAEDIAAHLARYEEYAERLYPRRNAIRQRLAALSPGAPKAEERWLKFAAFQSLLVRLHGALPVRPPTVEPPLDWFTVRGFPEPVARNRYESRAAAYSALAIQAKRNPTPPDNWLDEDGSLSSLDQPQSHSPLLQPDLSGAFLRVAESWVHRDRAGFEAAAEGIWQNREAYRHQRLDGLAVPDFWLAVFLNRMGLALGRLYEEAVSLRAAPTALRDGREAQQLIGALGMIAAERAWAIGERSEAAARAKQVSGLDPDNHAARFLLLLSVVEAGVGLEEHGLDFLKDYPWHLPRLLCALADTPERDSVIADGKLDEIYLRFVQRMQGARPLLSPEKVPPGAARYLARKLGVTPLARADDVLDALQRRGLLLTEEGTARNMIADPIAATRSP